jgi:toxin FitB
VTYLLDTNVVSETRKRQPAAGVVGWIAATPPGLLHVSVLTMGEIGQGVARVRGRGDHHQASALERWLRDVESGFGDRVLPVALPVAAAWGRQQYAQPLPVIDALIAATARECTA